jgi:hypothetical protein
MMYHSRSQELQRACAAELFNYSCRAGRPYFWVIFERITSKDKKITSNYRSGLASLLFGPSLPDDSLEVPFELGGVGTCSARNSKVPPQRH